MSEKEFVKVASDENIKAFVMQMTSFSLVQPAQKAQITLLLIEEIKILTKYLDFSDIFLKKKALELPEMIE